MTLEFKLGKGERSPRRRSKGHWEIVESMNFSLRRLKFLELVYSKSKLERYWIYFCLGTNYTSNSIICRTSKFHIHKYLVWGILKWASLWFIGLPDLISEHKVRQKSHLIPTFKCKKIMRKNSDCISLRMCWPQCLKSL